MTITRRLLLHLAAGTGLVLVVVTGVTHQIVYDALTASELRTIKTYVNERALREDKRFLEVQAKMHLVRGLFLERMAAAKPAGQLERWDYWYRLYQDGSWRSREDFKDARLHASMWAHKDWQDTPEARREVLVAQELCDEMLPAWVDAFPSYYFQFRGPLNIGVDTAIPEWAWDMPADYDWQNQEWMQLALPKVVADPDGFSWSGFLKDPQTPIALVCVYLPIIHQGKFLGSVGHNMSMESTLDSSTQCEISGASHLIFRKDGRMVAHPPLRQRIIASEGSLKAQESGDTTLQSLYRITLSHGDTSRFSGYDPVSETHYSFARLSGPGWLFGTIVPRAVLQKQAFASARWVLWSGLATLGLLLVLATMTFRRLVGRPLADLTRATHAMSADDNQTRALAQRTDDVGALARSFNLMMERVSARENDLREMNSDLERRVALRTNELSRALEREKELGEMKSSFVSLVSHEFRTPLGVIRSAADVLKAYHDRLSPEKRGRHLDMIAFSTRNLASLIDRVLMLGQVEDAQMEFHPKPLDLDKFCRSLSDEMRSATGGVCPIDFDAECSLDGATADESLLRHVFSNLLSNACKYSEPGISVSFSVRRVGDAARFIIKDHGIGIPEKDQEHLFTSFKRGGNVENRPGTGLGLVIVQRCVELHGGTLHLESSTERGTTVTVKLPLFEETSTSNIA